MANTTFKDLAPTESEAAGVVGGAVFVPVFVTALGAWVAGFVHID